jgi:hypothetical protein
MSDTLSFLDFGHWYVSPLYVDRLGDLDHSITTKRSGLDI